MVKPDYRNSIVNLMASLNMGLGGAPNIYAPLAALPPERIRKASHVVLCVIDGLGDGYVQEHGAAFKAHRHGRMTSVFPSSTAPALTSFATGLAPQQHGVTGWFMYLAELGTVATILPFQARWGGAGFASQGARMEAFIEGPSVFDRWEARCYFLNDEKLTDTPYSVTSAGRAERVGYRGWEDGLARVAALIQHADQPTFSYLYWPKYDALAHRYGVASVEVARHCRELENDFERWLETLAGTDTLVIVTADHGFIDTAPELTLRLEDHPRLRACLALPLCGEPRAAYGYVRPGKTAAFESYVMEKLGAYCDCHPSAGWLAAGWFGVGEATPALDGRIGDYVLIPKGHYVIKDTLVTEKSWNLIGVHGGASPEEMWVPLIIAQC